jgi:hypothetical protein
MATFLAALASPVVAPITNLFTSILDRVLPDKVANDQAKVELAKMTLNGELSQIMGQLEINKVEAASNSTFVAGWRPFIGWICGCAIAYEMILRPLLTFAAHAFGGHVDAPDIQTQDLIGLVVTMLGMGALRTIDKTQGSQAGH